MKSACAKPSDHKESCELTSAYFTFMYGFTSWVTLLDKQKLCYSVNIYDTVEERRSLIIVDFLPTSMKLSN